MAISGVMTARVWHRAGEGDAALYWSNVWELNSTYEELDTAQLDAVMDALAQFHRTLLMQPFHLDHIVLGTYVEDGKPYDPNVFRVGQYNAPGIRGGSVTNTTILPLVNVIRVSKEVSYGRSGALLLRGMLTEADTVSNSLTGLVSFADLAGLSLEIQSAYNAMAGDMASVGVQVVMASGEPPEISTRLVNNVLVKTLGKKNLRNKVRPRYSNDLLGKIKRALDTLQENQGALEIVRDTLSGLEWLAPLLLG